MICGYSGNRSDDYSGISRTPVGNFRYRSGETRSCGRADNDRHTQYEVMDWLTFAKFKLSTNLVSYYGAAIGRLCGEIKLKREQERAPVAMNSIFRGKAPAIQSRSDSTPDRNLPSCHALGTTEPKPSIQVEELLQLLRHNKVSSSWAASGTSHVRVVNRVGQRVSVSMPAARSSAVSAGFCTCIRIHSRLNPWTTIDRRRPDHCPWLQIFNVRL
ncbi:hypothetical protein BDW75DRAFT_52048 [Aspergillus navahoensis]